MKNLRKVLFMFYLIGLNFSLQGASLDPEATRTEERGSWHCLKELSSTIVYMAKVAGGVLKDPSCLSFLETLRMSTLLSIGAFGLTEGVKSLFFSDSSLYPPIFLTTISLGASVVVPVAVLIGIFGWREYYKRRNRAQNRSSREVFLDALKRAE